MRRAVKAICLFILISIISCLLAGCGSVGYETIPVPSGGWSRRELMSVSYLAECKLSYPPTYGDFKSKTKIRDDLIIEGKSFVSKVVYFDNKLLCEITYHCSNKKDEITDDSPIDDIYMEMSSKIMSSQICLNGIKIGSKKEDVIKALGEPAKWRMKETVADYKFTDGGYMTLDFELGILYSVSIHGLDR